MKVLGISNGSANVCLDIDELQMLNNALNEVCNGGHIDDEEFGTRLGWDRATVRVLLGEIHQISSGT